MTQTLSLGPPLRLTQTAYQAQTQRRNCRVLSNLILDSSPDISRSATTKTGRRAAGLKHRRQQRHHPLEKPQSSSHRRRQRTGVAQRHHRALRPDHIVPQAGTTSPNWPLGCGILCLAVSGVAELAGFDDFEVQDNEQRTSLIRDLGLGLAVSGRLTSRDRFFLIGSGAVPYP